MAAAPGQPPDSSSPPRQRAPAPRPCPPPPSPGCKAAPKSRAVARAAPAPGLLPDWQGSTAWAAMGREKGHSEVGCPIVTPAPITEGCRHRLQPPRHPAGLHPTWGKGRPWAFWGAGPSHPLPTRRPKESQASTAEPHMSRCKHGATLARETRLGALQGGKNEVENKKTSKIIYVPGVLAPKSHKQRTSRCWGPHALGKGCSKLF